MQLCDPNALPTYQEATRHNVNDAKINQESESAVFTLPANNDPSQPLHSDSSFHIVSNQTP